MPSTTVDEKKRAAVENKGAAVEEHKNAADPGKGAPVFVPPKKRRKWLRRLIILVVVIVVAAVLLRACMGGGGSVAVGGYLPVQASVQDMTITVTGSGTVKPNDSYRATTLLRGEILTAPFEEGDMVTKDQVLFTLDPTDAENAIDNAQSAVDRAQLGLEQAQLSLNDLLKTQSDSREDARVKANASGTVTKLYIEQGDTVAAGTPIADILDRDTMELTVPFHAVQAQTFQVGQAAQVSVTGSGSVLSGVISEIGAADQVLPGNAVVRQVVIQVPNPGALDQGSTAAAQVGEVASAGLGSFDYAQSKQVIALMSGEVETLSVREGDRVSNGQVLGSFEVPDLQGQIDTARLNVRSAELSLRDAQDGLRIAQDALEDYTISSPIDGTVIEKNYKAGDNIDPSTAAASGQSSYLAIIYDMSRLTFDMNVSELDVSRLQVGQSVTFTSSALEGQTFTGHVDKININGTTVAGSTNYPVTVVVDQGEGLYPGMNVSATILVEQLGNALCIPSDAVQRGNFVYVAGPGACNAAGELVNAGKLEERAVELGRSDSENIEILSGLEEGETVYIPNAASSAMDAIASAMGE